jgi:radical SAM superfamily enzyme YgiQ (UPF0313 family)
MAAPPGLLQPNPTFGNPPWEASDLRLLILRLSPFRDVQSSTPHLFLAQAARQGVPGAYIDFAFFPDSGQRRRCKEEGLPLVSGVESEKPLEAFELVLISNAYLLELLNLFYLLRRAPFALLSGERAEGAPLLLLGGSNALAAQALITEAGDCLVDGIFFGEGEEQVAGLLRRCQELWSVPRRLRLQELAAGTPGLWVPGRLDRPVRRAVCSGGAPPVAPYPVLNGPEASTVRLPLSYGCPFACAFCFEGHERKPYREIEAGEVVRAARELKLHSGAGTLELAALDPASHSGLAGLLGPLNRLFLQVRLMSQRPDSLGRAEGLLEAELLAGKRSFTFGIEGVSRRQRAFLQKGLAEREIRAVLGRVLAAKPREIKLFYILTGYEGEDDLAELADFADWLGAERAARHRGARVIFSFNRLLRMPFTPLRYDRLLLREADWTALAARCRTACRREGLEYRPLAAFGEYWCSQVMALGGYWLHRPLTLLAGQGHLFDLGLSRGAYVAFRDWLEAQGPLPQELAAEKPAAYPFALAFVENVPREEELLPRYRELRRRLQDRAVQGAVGSPARGPAASVRAAAQAPSGRKPSTLAASEAQPAAQGALAELADVMARKRQLQPLHARVWLPPVVRGCSPEWLAAWLMRELLRQHRELLENLLSARESLPLGGEEGGGRRFWFGESVLALLGWDALALRDALATASESTVGAGGSSHVLLLRGLLEDFRPGSFEGLRLRIRQPGLSLAEGLAALQAHLRGRHIPATVIREREGYRLEVPAAQRRRRVVLAGGCRLQDGVFEAELTVGRRYEMASLLDFPGHPVGGQGPQEVEILHVEP